MGNWNINIQGIGYHHNNKSATDADVMAAALVADLKVHHKIESATFTHGNNEKEDLIESAKEAKSSPIRFKSGDVVIHRRTGDNLNPTLTVAIVVWTQSGSHARIRAVARLDNLHTRFGGPSMRIPTQDELRTPEDAYDVLVSELVFLYQGPSLY